MTSLQSRQAFVTILAFIVKLLFISNEYFEIILRR